MARRVRRRATSSSSARSEPWQGRRAGLSCPSSNVEPGLAETEQTLEVDGEVVEPFKDGMSRIVVANGPERLGETVGEMSRYEIRILARRQIRLEL